MKKLIVSLIIGVCISTPAAVATTELVPPAQYAPIANHGAEARHHQIAAGSTPLVPQGVNNPECRVTPERPYAVILLHGTDASLYGDFAKLGAEIAADGWCTFGIDYGAGRDDRFGWGEVKQSAQQVDELIAQALQSSGAEKVQIIGFSQGAAVGRWWVNHIDQGERTHLWLGMASPTRGGSLYGLGKLAVQFPPLLKIAQDAGVVGQGAAELITGSPFVDELNAGGETVPGPAYVTISTRTDEVMPEWANQPIYGERTRNIVQQDLCPENLGGHMYMTYNPTITQLVRFLLVDWQSGGNRGEIQCQSVPLGAFLPELVIADKLQKLQDPMRRPQPVTYGIVQ